MCSLLYTQKVETGIVRLLRNSGKAQHASQEACPEDFLVHDNWRKVQPSMQHSRQQPAVTSPEVLHTGEATPHAETMQLSGGH